MFTTYLIVVLIGLVLAFFCGSIPFALIIGRGMKGLDVREHGSGNAGTTNAIRVLGLGPGLLVFAGDVFKGALGCLIMSVMVGVAITVASTQAVEAALATLDGVGATGAAGAAGAAVPELDPLIGLLASGNGAFLYDVPMAIAILATILGHMFSPFMGFKGGKGVATALGSIGVALPIAAGLAFAVFIVVVLITRYVSLGSCIAVVTVPIFTWLFYGSPTFTVFTALVAVAVVLAHKKNLVRLARGEEVKFSPPRREKA